MKRLLIGLMVVAATIVAPGLAPQASATTLCNQCHEQAVINAIRCMSTGPFWLC